MRHIRIRIRIRNHPIPLPADLLDPPSIRLRGEFAPYVHHHDHADEQQTAREDGGGATARSSPMVEKVG